jgi:CheY-like chemotaxis protein
MATPAPAKLYRLLIVDDEEGVRNLVDRVLRQPGYDTRVAADGVEALKLAETDGPFDLLVSDVSMPGMRGDELARRLRHDNPALKILYLTGYSDQLFDARTTLWEDEAFLEKPATVQGILEAVSLLLVGTLPAPRAPRVRIPDARVHVGDTVTDLDSLSLTGALVLAAEEIAVDSVWPLTLDLPTDTIRVNARVVRCRPRQAGGPAPARFEIAVAFVDRSNAVQRALARVCSGPTAMRV